MKMIVGRETGLPKHRGARIRISLGYEVESAAYNQLRFIDDALPHY